MKGRNLINHVLIPALLLTLSAILLWTTAYATESTSFPLASGQFWMNPTTNTIYSVSGEMDDLTLTISVANPDINDGKGFVAEEAFAFENIGVQKVVVEEGITSIGRAAFYKCGFTSVSLPASLTEIIEYAFGECDNLADVTFADQSKLETIGQSAFIYCPFTSLRLPASVKEIQNSAFLHCYNLSSVTFIEGSWLESIGSQAFSNCGFSSIVLPCANLTSIGQYAFDTNVYMEDRIRVEKIVCLTQKKIQADGKIVSGQDNTVMYFLASKRAENSGLTGMAAIKGISSVSPGLGIARIEGIPVYENYYAEGDTLTVTVTDTVSALISNPSFYIGETQLSATAKGNGVYEVTLPSSMTADAVTIGIQPVNISDASVNLTGGPYVWTKKGDAFMPGVTVNGIPLTPDTDYSVVYTGNNRPGTATATVTGKGVFTGTKSVSFTITAATSGSWGDGVTWNYNAESHILAFTGEGALAKYESSNQMDNSSPSAFPWYWFRESIETINFGSGITSIPYWAFEKYIKLREVNIDEKSKLETIGIYAFYGCSKLTSFTIPASVTTIGSNAFYYCKESGSDNGLKAVTIERSNETTLKIGLDVFRGCPTDLAITLVFTGNDPLIDHVDYITTGAYSIDSTYSPEQPFFARLAFTYPTGSAGSDGTVTAKVFHVHQHSFTYTAEGTTITATCSGEGDMPCNLPDNKTTLTIVAPSSLIYDGKAKNAVLDGLDTFNATTGLAISAADIVYTQNGSSLDSAPVSTGSYKATLGLDVDGTPLTVSVEYTVDPKPVSVSGIIASSRSYEPDNLTVSLTGGTVDGKIDSDDVTADLTNAAGLVETADAGENKPVTVTGVKLGGDDAGNYTIAEQSEDVTVTITKAVNTAVVTEAVSACIDRTVDLSKTIRDAQGSVLYTIQEDAAGGCSVDENTGIFTPGTTEGTCIVTVTITGNKNYKEAVASITVSVVKILPEILAPTAITGLIVSQSPQPLLVAGTAEGGMMRYAIGDNNETAPTSGWSENIPTGTEAKTYYVWYKAIGDEEHSDSDAFCVSVTLFPEFDEVSAERLVMPTQLNAIRDSAFSGDRAITVVSAKTCTSVGEHAFENSGVTQIRLSKDCLIGIDAFKACDSLIAIYAPAGGTTEKWCTENNVPFAILPDEAQ